LVITVTDPDVPRFFQDVRGSSNGHRMANNDIWFLCHLVSYEDRRYYYHLWVVLDGTTFKYKRHGALWTFTGDKVEYALGWVPPRSGNAVVVGFSAMDRSTHVAEMTPFLDAI
jgi:hypothetical protein